MLFLLRVSFGDSIPGTINILKGHNSECVVLFCFVFVCVGGVGVCVLCVCVCVCVFFVCFSVCFVFNSEKVSYSEGLLFRRFFFFFYLKR